MAGIPRRIDNPFDIKAEGLVYDFAYDTQIASIDGCALHIWTMSDEEPTKETLEAVRKAYARMRNERDIVYATFSKGRPAGFWTRQDVI